MMRPMHRWTYPAAAVRVVDGDTIDLLIDKGFKEYKEVRVRLLGIDTPERGEEGFEEATTAVEDWMTDARAWFVVGEGFPLLFESFNGKLDSFGRYLGRVWRKNGEDLCERLLYEGLAKEYKR